MIVNIILYVLLVLGLFIIFSGSFKEISYKMKLRSNIQASKGIRKKADNTDALTEHLYMLLAVTLGAKSRSSVTVFSFICGLAALAGYLFSSIILPATTCIIVAVACAALPYLILRTMLQRFRISISHEGEILVTELLNNYKINHYNIREAIEQTALQIADAPHSKKMLYDLARNLNTAATKEDIKKSLDLFKYSIGTSWANILASNMYFAQVDGIVITNSLTDLTDAITKARKAVEMNRRENTEAMMILKYMIPIGYVLTIVGADVYFRMPFEKFIYYQFMTETGVTWFLGMVALYIASIIITVFLSKTKMDI